MTLQAFDSECSDVTFFIYFKNTSINNINLIISPKYLGNSSSSRIHFHNSSHIIIAKSDTTSYQ